MAAKPTVNTLFWDVDTQVDFMRSHGKLYVPEAETIIPALRLLTMAARELEIPLVASADDHEPGDPELSDSPDFETTYPPHCLRGTPGVERIPETRQAWSFEVGHEPLDDEALRRGLAAAAPPRVLVHKKRFDVFTNPNTEQLLDLLAPQRIVVYGVALDVCNRHAIEGMLERGQRELTLVTDATKPIHAERVPALLDDWRGRGVRMRSTDEVLGELATPQPDSGLGGRSDAEA